MCSGDATVVVDGDCENVYPDSLPGGALGAPRTRAPAISVGAGVVLLALGRLHQAVLGRPWAD